VSLPVPVVTDAYHTPAATRYAAPASVPPALLPDAPTRKSEKPSPSTSPAGPTETPASSLAAVPSTLASAVDRLADAETGP